MNAGQKSFPVFLALCGLIVGPLCLSKAFIRLASRSLIAAGGIPGNDREVISGVAGEPAMAAPP